MDKWESNGMIYRTVCSLCKISKEITKLISILDGRNFINDPKGVSNVLELIN